MDQDLGYDEKIQDPLSTTLFEAALRIGIGIVDTALSSLSDNSESDDGFQEAKLPSTHHRHKR